MPPYGENGVLFTTEYIYLRQMAKLDTLSLQTIVVEAIDTTIAPPSDGERLSHDNMTAIICASKFYGLNYHKKYFHRDWWWRAHPKDIGFSLYNLNLFTRILSIPFMVVLIADMFISCGSGKRVSNGDLDTDGILLSWLRCKAMKWHTIEKICLFLLKKRNNCGWKEIFMIYFRKDYNNPIVKLVDKLY
jgi:hypothetical protein